jgi:hypothetical protein
LEEEGLENAARVYTFTPEKGPYNKRISVPNHLYMLFKALSLEPEGFQFAGR